jgi:hypothetical protein
LDVAAGLTTSPVPAMVHEVDALIRMRPTPPPPPPDPSF